VDNGTNIRLVNQGDAGPKGGKPGHLFIRLTVPEDKVFKREGTHVHTHIPITISQAVLGGTVKVPTLSGEEVEIKIPSGTQPDEQRVLRGKGIPAVGRSDTRGNHYIHFKLIVPSKLSPRQKELMEEFGREESSNSKDGLFGKMRGIFGKQ
jgi:molecular chaperone DnaJ